MDIDNLFSERLKYSIIFGVKNGFSGIFYEHDMAVNGFSKFGNFFLKVYCDFLKSVTVIFV